jgi:murein L,D-transpeptidase YcbB/YkuD
MRQSSTIWLSAVAWVSSGTAALLIPHLALAAPAATGPADVAPAAITEMNSPQEPGPTAPDDVPIAEKIRVLVGAPLDTMVDDAKDRDALRRFYEGRSHAPVWVRSGGPTDQFRAAVARLTAADADGLTAGDYPAPDIKSLAAGPEKLARAELTLMASLMTYARHAQSGRVNPSRISPNIAVTPPVPEPLHVLNTLASADDVAGALDAFNPPHRGFQELKAKLGELRRSGSGESRAESRRSGIPNAIAIDSILSNMERWRWLPRDLGAAYVLVNIPAYTLDVMRGERSAFHTRIVVGKKTTPSPIFSDEIETVQVNPTWHVPESIVYGQYLPALSRDPGALRRMGLIVSRARDGTVTVRQPPGPRNALGRLKVNFPNPFHVYLHDTPDKHLFTREQRAYSSGCMRVQNPDQFAAQVLSIGGADGNYTPARLTSMYGTAERWIALTSRVPIHIVYMTTYVADSGKLVVKPDIYGYDARVQSALKGRYLVVKERSQRGSSVVRSARASRSAAGHSSRARVAQKPARTGWQERPTAFGVFWGWNSGY